MKISSLSSLFLFFSFQQQKPAAFSRLRAFAVFPAGRAGQRAAPAHCPKTTRGGGVFYFVYSNS